MKKLEDRVDLHVLTWFGHAVRIEDGRSMKRVMIKKTSGPGPRERPTLAWMNNVKQAFVRKDIGVGDPLSLTC